MNLVCFICDSTRNFLYLTIAVKCGFVCNQQEDCPVTGVFQSFNYPSPYPNHEDCQWNFIASPGYSIVIKITDFYTESSYDSLLFYDGPIASNNLKFQRYTVELTGWFSLVIAFPILKVLIRKSKMKILSSTLEIRLVFEAWLIEKVLIKFVWCIRIKQSRDNEQRKQYYCAIFYRCQ